MAMSPTILKEFLAKLGFQIDEQQYKRFESRLAAVTQHVERMGKIALVAGGALSAALLKTASDLEKLYFAAQRAETSVAGLMGIRFAAEQIGVGADAAAAGILGLATAIRTNPGLRLFFTQLGLKDVGDNTQNFINLISKLQQISAQGPFGHAIATQIAAQFGIDEQTLFIYEKHLPELIRAQQEFKKLGLLGGVNVDQQAEAFHNFMVDVRKLLATVELLAIAFGGKLLPFADHVVRALQAGAEWLLKMNVATHGLSTLFVGILATLVASMGALRAMSGILGLFGGGAAAAGAGAAGAEVGGAVAAGGSGIIALMGGTAAIIAIAAIVVGWLTYHYRSQLGQFFGIGPGARPNVGLPGFINRMEGKMLQMYKDTAGNWTIGVGHKIRPGEDFSKGITNEQADKLFQNDMGSALSTVMRLVKVKLSQNQTAALTDLVFNVGSGAFARSTLLKDVNAGNFSAAADEFLKWNRAGGAESAGLMNRRLGERSLFIKPDVNLSQQTTIHVNGTEDPRETANLVSGQQRLVNGQIVRDMAAKIQ